MAGQSRSPHRQIQPISAHRRVDVGWACRRDTGFHFTPLLAESREQPYLLTLVFDLRDGVRFHDGHPLTARRVRRSATAPGPRSSCRQSLVPKHGRGAQPATYARSSHAFGRLYFSGDGRARSVSGCGYLPFLRFESQRYAEKNLSGTNSAVFRQSGRWAETPLNLLTP
jgi:hypothetical protein